MLAALFLWTQIGVAFAPTTLTALKVRLDVSGSQSCATKMDLERRVVARVPRVRFVDEHAVLDVHVSFTVETSGNVVGDLVLGAPGATTTPRRLVAGSCAQAADATALVIAVTLDPTSAGREAGGSDGTRSTPDGDGSTDASMGGPRATPGKVGESPSKPSAASPSATEAPRGATDRSIDRTRPAETPSETTSPAESPGASRQRFGALVAAQSYFGATPGILPGIAVYATAGIDREAPFSPAFLLGATHAWRSGIEEQGGAASFSLDAASLDVCPVRFVRSALEARACGSGLFGRLSAEGSATRNAPGTVARPFAAVGAAALFTLRISANVEVSARAAVDANLVRDSFEFSPRVFHTVAPVTLAVSLGVGLRSP